MKRSFNFENHVYSIYFYAVLMFLLVPNLARTNDHIFSSYKVLLGYSYESYNSRDKVYHKGKVHSGYLGLESQFQAYISWLNTAYFGSNQGGEHLDTNPIEYQMGHKGFSFAYETGLRFYLGTPYAFCDLALGFSTYNSPYKIKSLHFMDAQSAYNLEGIVLINLGFNIPFSKELFLQVIFKESYHFGNRYARGYMGAPFGVSFQVGWCYLFPKSWRNL